MGLLTKKKDTNPYSRDIDELLDRMDEEKETEKESKGSYEESLKKIEERIRELGTMDEEEEENDE